MLKFFLNMTKSEILIYKMIEQSSDWKNQTSLLVVLEDANIN